MILREQYESDNSLSQQGNILANAYRIHDQLERKVRELGSRNYRTVTPIAVQFIDFSTEESARAALEKLQEILTPAQWSIRYDLRSTDRVQYDLPVYEVTWLMEK